MKDKGTSLFTQNSVQSYANCQHILTYVTHLILILEEMPINFHAFFPAGNKSSSFITKASYIYIEIFTDIRRSYLQVEEKILVGGGGGAVKTAKKKKKFCDIGSLMILHLLYCAGFSSLFNRNSTCILLSTVLNNSTYKQFRKN